MSSWPKELNPVPGLSNEARLAAWWATNDPTRLWPQVPAAAREAAILRVTDTVRAALRGGQAVPRLGAASPQDRDAIGIAAYRTGTGPLLGWWVARGLVPADPRIATLLYGHLQHNRRRVEVMTAALVRILECFSTARVTPILLKGAHTARAYFPDPATRPATDLDLLVAPGDLELARAALQEAGFAEVRHTRHPSRSEWTEAGRPPTVASLELEHADNPWSVDLHTTLERWYFRGRRAGFGYPAKDQLVEYDVGGRAVGALGQPLLTAFLALHASYAISDFRALRAVELALVIRSDLPSGALRWDALADLLGRTGTERFVYPALELTERWLPGTLDGDLRQRLHRAATARMRRVVDEVEAHGLQLVRRSLDEKLMWARGPAEVFANWADLVWPGDDMWTAGDKVSLYFRRARMFLQRRAAFTALRRGRNRPGG